MSNLTKARRGLAAGVATAVGAAALSVVAVAPAQAAAPAPGSLSWGVSQQFMGFNTQTLSDGVTASSTSFQFPQTGAAAAGGVTTLSYGGSVKGAFVFGGTEHYSVTIASPTVTVEANGDAVVSAMVSSESAAAEAMPPRPATPAASIPPTRVNVLSVPTTGSLTAGFTAAASADFASTLFDALVPGVQAHFRQTSTATPPVEQPKKRPAGFTATTSPVTTVQKSVTGTSATLDITGSSFVGGNADYQGVYVGVAPSGGMPDVTVQANMDKFVASDWIRSGTIVDGAFTSRLVVDLTKVEAGQTYSLYTWQAHRSTTRALDSETTLGVLVEKVAPPVVNPPVVNPPVVTKATAKLKTTWTKKPSAKKAGKLKVTVKKAAGAKAATGKAKVTFKVGKTTKRKTVRVKNGKATVKVPKRTKKVTVKYLGDSAYLASKKKTVRV